jgi:molybdopterin-guanine dinucleotide biosynthesis protein A
VAKSAQPPDVVVLAGGSGRRMGGVDKPSLYVGQSTLLDRVLRAIPDASRVVVVGPFRSTCRSVHWTREDPPGGGPVPALAAGLELVTSAHVVLLAADLPHLTTETVHTLATSVTSDGVVLVDDSGKEQYLCSAWRTTALRSADLTVPRLKDVVAQLNVDRLALPVAPGSPLPWYDCDTPEDLEVARESA